MPAAALLALTFALADAPLPEARSFVDRLIANQKAVDERRENYTYKIRQQTFDAERKKDGVRWRKKEDRLLQVYPSRRLPVERLLEKDGRPLTEKEQRKEDERIDKQIRVYEKKQAARGAEDDEAPNPGEVRLRDLLRATVLSTVGREEVDGRRCLVIDFTGNPDFKPKTRGEKLARALEGRMWVDEEDLEVARAEARLGKVSWGAGIVAKIKEARFYFEQTREKGELWLPVRADAEWRARVLLVKGYDQRVSAEFFDYQRYGTSTEVSFGETPDPDCSPSSAAGD